MIASADRAHDGELAGATLLVVEDDDAIAEPLLRGLKRVGFDTRHAGTAGDARRALSAGAAAGHREWLPDIVLLDLGLPDGDGVELCRWVKARHPTISVVMLSARTSENEVVVGLDAGADDYVAKPFRFAELQARLRARLRSSPRRRILRAQDIEIDTEARTVTRSGLPLDLTLKEFDLLQLLLSRAGATVARDEIMRLVWDEHWFGTTRTLDMFVLWLRRKLGDDASAPRYISTVRGVGFRFER